MGKKSRIKPLKVNPLLEVTLNDFMVWLMSCCVDVNKSSREFERLKRLVKTVVTDNALQTASDKFEQRFVGDQGHIEAIFFLHRLSVVYGDVSNYQACQGHEADHSLEVSIYHWNNLGLIRMYAPRQAPIVDACFQLLMLIPVDSLVTEVGYRIFKCVASQFKTPLALSEKKASCDALTAREVDIEARIEQQVTTLQGQFEQAVQAYDANSTDELPIHLKAFYDVLTSMEGLIPLNDDRIVDCKNRVVTMLQNEFVKGWQHGQSQASNVKEGVRHCQYSERWMRQFIPSTDPRLIQCQEDLAYLSCVTGKSDAI